MIQKARKIGTTKTIALGIIASIEQGKTVALLTQKYSTNIKKMLGKNYKFEEMYSEKTSGKIIGYNISQKNQ